MCATTAHTYRTQGKEGAKKLVINLSERMADSLNALRVYGKPMIPILE